MNNNDLTKYGENCIGNVIRILDTRTLIVNAGKDVLSVGMKIKVYEPLDMLHNPDGSDLCQFEYTKDILKVIEVENNYAICQKKKKITTNSMTLAISPLLSMQKTEYIPLEVDENEIEPLTGETSVIHIGDPIKIA